MDHRRTDLSSPPASRKRPLLSNATACTIEAAVGGPVLGVAVDSRCNGVSCLQDISIVGAYLRTLKFDTETLLEAFLLLLHPS